MAKVCQSLNTGNFGVRLRASCMRRNFVIGNLDCTCSPPFNHIFSINPRNRANEKMKTLTVPQQINYMRTLVISMRNASQ